MRSSILSLPPLYTVGGTDSFSQKMIEMGVVLPQRGRGLKISRATVLLEPPSGNPGFATAIYNAGEKMTGES